MTSPMPPDTRNGRLLPGSQWGTTGQVWVVTFGPYQGPRYLSSIAIVPPNGIPPKTPTILFSETVKISVAPNATSTEYEPYRMKPIVSGTSIYLVWFTSQGTTPEATLYSEGPRYL